MAVDPVLLRTFLAVARAGSVSGAAAAVHRSQPAVSAQVRRLEDGLGDRLFRRHPRGVRLTPLGERLLPYAEALERVVVGVGELAADVRGLSTGALDVAASTTIALYWLPERIAAFGHAHPAVAMRVRTRNSREAVDALAAGDVDLALVEGTADAWATLPADVYVARPVFEDTIVVVAPPGHPLADRRRVDPADLDGLDAVGREAGSGTREVVDRALAAAGVRLRVRLEVTEPEAMKRAVRAGMGIALMSAVAVRAEAAAGTIAAIPCSVPGLGRAFTLLTPADALASRPARAFAATVLGTAAAPDGALV